MRLARRSLLKTAVALVGTIAGNRHSRAVAAAASELKLPDGATTETFDFDARGIDGWTTVSGRWTVQNMAGAPSGPKVLVHGRRDASGGIVFRFTDGKYDVVRGNALEDNFRLYSYDRGRRQLAGGSVKRPALGQWHTVRVVAVGDRIQAWLDGAPRLDHRDARFKAGGVGLWTKADSITAFDDLVIRGTKGA
jgi:hypothetical protein